MEDKRFSIVRAGSLYVGDRRGRLGTLVSNKSLFDRHTIENFEIDPVTSIKLGGVAGGTAGNENMMCLGHNMFEWHVLGTQTILTPKIVATGLDVNMDQTDNDGLEVSQGILANSKSAFVVGTDEFYAKLKFSIADVSGSDDCAFGFRTAEAYQGNIDDYDEMAALNVISGTITIETILNGGATGVTSTTDTWADGAEHTLEIYVRKDGVVTFKIDGAAPTTTAAFTFDSGEVVLPFFYFLNASDVAGAVVLTEWECGLQ